MKLRAVPFCCNNKLLMIPEFIVSNFNWLLTSYMVRLYNIIVGGVNDARQIK